MTDMILKTNHFASGHPEILGGLLRQARKALYHEWHESPNVTNAFIFNISDIWAFEIFVILFRVNLWTKNLRF